MPSLWVLTSLGSLWSTSLLAEPLPLWPSGSPLLVPMGLPLPSLCSLWLPSSLDSLADDLLDLLDSLAEVDEALVGLPLLCDEVALDGGSRKQHASSPRYALTSAMPPLPIQHIKNQSPPQHRHCNSDSSAR
jgi:hypothetical protein